MSGQIPIRMASAATLLSLAVLAVAEFAGAQNGPAPSQTEAPQLSIPLLSPDRMAPVARAAAQSWQPAVANSAQFYGYALDSSYSYREIACPVAPDHLLLAYEATAPNGSVSRFTAVVRRAAEEEAGRHPVAQIIPILHFGVVPFIPAIANPHSIEVFNAAISPAPSATEVLSANRAGNQPILVRALCYLAMVGEEPAALGSPSSDQATIHAPVPTLVFQSKGRIRQLVSIRSSQNTYQVWALTFQSGGSLLTATRQEHPVDRTPLVLNAANGGAPASSTGTTGISAGPTQVSAPSPPPMASSPPALAAAIAPPHPAPAEPAASAAKMPPSPTPTAEAAMVPTPPTPPAKPAEIGASTSSTSPTITVPPPSAMNSSNLEAASTAKPVALEAPTMAAPLPTALPRTPLTPVSGAVSAPQPMNSVVPASPAISGPPASVAMLPVVKSSAPLPPGRFIPNPPRPPSRFIPDSALKTPPHLPQ